MYKYNTIQNLQGKIDEWRKILINDSDSLIKYLKDPIIDGWVCVYKKFESNLNFFSTINGDIHFETLKKRLPERNDCNVSNMVCSDDLGVEEYPLVYKRRRDIYLNLESLPKDSLTLNPILFDRYHDSIFLDKENDMRGLTYLNSLGAPTEFMIIEDDIAIANYASLCEFLRQEKYLLVIYFIYTNPPLLAEGLKFCREEHDGIIYHEYKKDEKLIRSYGGKIIRANNNNTRIPEFVVSQNEHSQDLKKSLSDIDENQLLAFQIKALERYKGKFCYINDKEIRTPRFSLQIARSTDDKYFYVFAAHLKLIPATEQSKLAEYSVNVRNATAISSSDLEVISCGIPNNPSNAKYLFKLLYSQLSKCWQCKYGYELFSFTKSKKQIEKCLSTITDFSSDAEALASNLRILVIESLNTEDLKTHDLFKDIGLNTEQRGCNHKFYSKVGVHDKLIGQDSNMYILRQSNSHYTPDETVLKITKTETKIIEDMIEGNIKVLLWTHSYLKCSCFTFKGATSTHKYSENIA